MDCVGSPQAGTWRHSDLALPVCSGPSTKEKGNEEEGPVSRALEPLTGIEPARPAWKAGVLPLNYSDVWCREQIPPTPGGLLVCSELPRRFMRRGYGLPRVEPLAGLEPAASWLQISCSTAEPQRRILCVCGTGRTRTGDTASIALLPTDVLSHGARYRRARFYLHVTCTDRVKRVQESRKPLQRNDFFTCLLLAYRPVDPKPPAPRSVSSSVSTSSRSSALGIRQGTMTSCAIRSPRLMYTSFLL